MNKKISILIIFVLLIIGTMVLFWTGIQKVETNKKVYIVGEKIVYSLADLRLRRCENDIYASFYRQIDGQWAFVRPNPDTYHYYCLDGKHSHVLDTSELADCCEECNFFNKPILKKTEERKLIIFEQIADEPCKMFPKERADDIDKKKSLENYISKPAPAGLYKIKFGNAKAIFEIK